MVDLAATIGDFMVSGLMRVVSPADICLVDCQTRHLLQNMADMLYPLSRRIRRSW